MTDIVPIAQELIGKIDPAILEAAAKGIATAIGKVAGEAGIKLLGDTNSKLLDGVGNLNQAAQDLLFPISRKYIENYTERHGTLKVLGMGKPVSLDSVYTKVNFQADTIRGYRSLEDLEKLFRERSLRDKEKRPGLNVANQEQYLMVLGNPGTGKTTFLRKVGLEALKGKGRGEYKHTCIPILLELRKFRSGEINLVQAIASEFENCGLPEYQDCTEKLLEKGRLLILLDGLDEVPSDRLNAITTQIRDLLDLYSDNRFIISCRIAAYRNFDNFRRFTDVAIADFDDEQIETFIGKWFESHSQPEWGEQCWEKLNSGNHNATKELTRTPLLLTLICILFKKRGEFPNKRATVYNEAFWTMLSEWDASKEIVRQQLYKGMDTKCKEILLAEIAYENFVSDNLFFQQGEITQQIEEILGEMLPDENFIHGREVLRAIEEQHGVLVSRADDIYSFSHVTLQEFMTAKHIVDNGLDIQELVDNYLCDRRWQEVFLILAGLRRADNLFLKIEQAIHYLIDTPKLQNLLIWLEQVTDNSAGDIQSLGKRVIAYANAISKVNNIANSNAITSTYSISKIGVLTNANASAIGTNYADNKANLITNINTYTSGIAQVKAYANGIADSKSISDGIEQCVNYARWAEKFQIYRNINYIQLITRLEKLKQRIPSIQKLLEVRKEFGNKTIQTCLEAFHLTSEILDLSDSEIKALDNYLYANLLMVECQKAAVRVSRETWSGIESRMLLPVRN